MATSPTPRTKLPPKPLRRRRLTQRPRGRAQKSPQPTPPPTAVMQPPPVPHVVGVVAAIVPRVTATRPLVSRLLRTGPRAPTVPPPSRHLFQRPRRAPPLLPSRHRTILVRTWASGLPQMPGSALVTSARVLLALLNAQPQPRRRCRSSRPPLPRWARQRPLRLTTRLFLPSPPAVDCLLHRVWPPRSPLRAA